MIVRKCDICLRELELGHVWHLELMPTTGQSPAVEVLRWEVCPSCATALRTAAQEIALARRPAAGAAA